MFVQSLAVVLLLASSGWALEATEPQFPTSICGNLTAVLQEGPVGFLPTAAESTPDTSRIQAALNNCGAGKALKLLQGTGNAFLSGPLTLPTGVTLWIDSGVTLFASRNPRDFDQTSGSCGVLAASGDGCRPLISAPNTKNSGIVGAGTIDGRGGQKMIGGSMTWWELAVAADGSGKAQNCPRLVVVTNSQSFTAYKIQLHNSPNFHFVTTNVNGLTVWSVTVNTPTSAYPSSTHARNTDGFDPNGQNMVFSDLYVNTGDDNIAIKGGKSPVSNVIVQNSHFYQGHGMSIGSETNMGVSNVTVTNLSIDGADNGIRIKSDASNGGLVTGVTYSNICIRNVGSPLVFDSFYTNAQGTNTPKFQDIHVTNTHIISSTQKQAVFRGHDASNPLQIFLDNVVTDVALTITASNAVINVGPGANNIGIKADSANNVKVVGTPGQSTAVDCSKMFVPFPS